VYDKEISKLFYMMMVPKENNIIVTTNVEKDNYKKIIEKSIERYNTTGKIIKKGIFPITKLKSLTEIETGKDNILLVGESAGFVKPILGDGLSLALETAELAAKSILEGPNNSNLIYKELCIPICEGLQTEIDYLEHI
jgi:flavin-dependent dehydrogenase